MSSVWGKNILISIFGESHGPAVGVTLDSPCPGFEIDMEKLGKHMKRRSSNNLPWATSRKEDDIPEILSGLWKGKTTGTPLCGVIRNMDTRSGDYEKTVNTPRPGHADLTAYARYGGYQDPRGGGHFSGRLTAPLVFAGGICKQILESRGVYIFTHIASVGDIDDKKFNTASSSFKDLRHLGESFFPVLDHESGEKMKQAIMEAKKQKDSLGGKIECMAAGFPPGIGSPVFESIESKISSIMFSVPAVKAVSFGLGFDSTRLKGSQNNDSPYFTGNPPAISYKTNNAGGIEGGISNGMPIVCTAGIKPTPSVSLTQDSIDIKEKSNRKVSIKGRHDPCIVPRACVVVESAMAIALLDMYLDFYPGDMKDE